MGGGREAEARGAEAAERKADAPPRRCLCRTGEANEKLEAQRTSQLDPSLQLQAGAPPWSRGVTQSSVAFEPPEPPYWSREVAIRKDTGRARTTAGITRTPLGTLPPCCLVPAWGGGEPMGQELGANPLSDWPGREVGMEPASKRSSRRQIPSWRAFASL